MMQPFVIINGLRGDKITRIQVNELALIIISRDFPPRFSGFLGLPKALKARERELCRPFAAEIACSTAAGFCHQISTHPL